MKKHLVFLSPFALQQHGHRTKINPETYFQKKDLMTIGTYYYPEHWPQNQWSKDIKKMGELGFEFTHFGEFAWTFIEPSEGKFDFVWLDQAVALAAQNGIKVIMCTSSPTPPAWLAQQHPEILMVNDEGRTMQHGSRQQISWSSPVYRNYVAKMVEALAKHYANDQRIWGWQLDNEPSHYGQYDYSDAAQESFKKWLQKNIRISIRSMLHGARLSGVSVMMILNKSESLIQKN